MRVEAVVTVVDDRHGVLVQAEVVMPDEVLVPSSSRIVKFAFFMRYLYEAAEKVAIFRENSVYMPNSVSEYKNYADDH